MKNTWRSIWIMTFASFAMSAAALVIVRTVPTAVAQSTDPPAKDTPAAETPEEGTIDDEPAIGAPVTRQEEIPPELRQSADNNVSFPVDI